MLRYLIKRIFIFFPTFIVISLLAFVISTNAPGDPVERLTNSADSEGAASTQNTSNKQDKERIRAELGLDKPIFYFSLTSLAQSDTLYKVIDLGHQDNLAHLTSIHGNWDAIVPYYNALLKANNAHAQFREAYKDSVYNHYAFLADSTMITVDSLFEGYTYIKDTTTVTRDTTIYGYEYVVGTEIRTTDTTLTLNYMRDSTVITLDTLIVGFQYLRDSTMSYRFSKNDINEAINRSSLDITELLETALDAKIKAKFEGLDSLYAQNPFLESVTDEFALVKTTYEDLLTNAEPWKAYVPSLNFYGANQYHSWLFGDAPWWGGTDADTNLRQGILRGDFGISYMDQKPIGTKIWEAFLRSFWLIFVSVILAYLVSIPIGIYAGYKRNSMFDKGSSVVLFILYSLPTFFIGTLLLMMFASPDYLYWFPSGGYQDPVEIENLTGWWERLFHRIPYTILPLITYTYGSFAFLSRIMRTGMVEVINQDYIRTARAKGLSERKVVLKHAFRNSLLPIITVFANIFPVAVGGSVIIETIFSYPGMGLESYNAIRNQDYPMIIAVFTMAGFLTMVGYLVADVLYALVDPRISYGKK